MSLFSFVFLTASSLFAQEYVGVLDVEGDVSEAIKMQLAYETRAGALTALPDDKFSILTRENMLSVLKDQNKDAKCFEGSCEVEIGRNIGADFILSGQVVQIEGVYLYSIKLHNTYSGALVGTERIEGISGLDLVRNTASETEEFLINTMKISEVPKQIPATPSESLKVVQFNSTPSGAEVWLEKKQVCPSTPCSIGVREGFHIVEYRKDFYQPWKAEFQAKGGLEVRAQLTAHATTLHLKATDPGIQVFLDDIHIGTSPIQQQTITPGPHILRYEGPCSRPHEERFVAKDGVDVFREIKIKSYMSPIQVKAINQVGKPIRARIYLDGEFVGYTPFNEDIPTCSNRIEVEAEVGGYTQRRSLPLSLKDNTSEDITLEFFIKKNKKRKKKKTSLVGDQQTYFFGYNIAQFHSDILIATLNGRLNQQWEETGQRVYQTDISSFLTQESLNGLEFGYEKLSADYFFDVSLSIFFQPNSTWIEHAYPIPVTYLGRFHVQASIGRFYKQEDTILLAGLLFGGSSTWMDVNEDFTDKVTLQNEEESPSLRHETLRTGIRFGARSGKQQGLRVAAEIGIDLEGNTDKKFFLGYFFRI
jgi:hypothetical protein